MKYIKSFLICLMVLTIVGCGTDLLPFLQFEVENLSGKTPIELDVDGNCAMEKPIRITASDELEWSITHSEGWLHCTPASGSGSQDISVKANTNLGYTSRQATFTVDCDGMKQTFSVTQAPSTQLEVTSVPNPLTSAAQKHIVDIRSNTSWTAAPDQPWCTIKPNSGTGNGKLEVSVEENGDTIQRTAIITLKTTKGDNTDREVTLEVIQGKYGAQLILEVYSLSFKDSDISKTVKITSSDALTAVSDAEWCTVSPTSLPGSGEISVSVSNNKTVEDRTAHVTVKNKFCTEVIEVKQDKHVPTLDVDPTAWSFKESADHHAFKVTTKDKWKASVKIGEDDEKDWCTLVNSERDGDGELTVNVKANKTEKDRTVIITVELIEFGNTATVTITQDKHTANLYFSEKKWENVTASGDTRTFTFTTTDDWELTLPESDATWCSVSPTKGTNTTSRFTVTLAPNKTIQKRSTTLTVKTDYREEKISISQKAYEPSLTVANKSIQLDESGAEQMTTISSSDAWTATITEEGDDMDWCKVKPLKGESGDNKSITFSATPNTKTEPRTATVTIDNGYKKETITVTQAAHVPYLRVTDSKDNELADNVTLTFNSDGQAIDSDGKVISSGNTLFIHTEDAWETLQELTYSDTEGVMTLTPDHWETGYQMVISFQPYERNYQCKLTIRLKNHPTYKKVITIIKKKLETTLSLSTNELHFDGIGGEKFVDVTCDGEWTIVNNYTSWLTTNIPGSQQYGRFYITAAPNDTGESRTAKISVRAAGAISQSITIIQEPKGEEIIIPGEGDNPLPHYTRRKK